MGINLSIKDDALYYRESPSNEWAFVCTMYELTEEGMYKHKMKNMIEQIKELRVKIDGLYQLTKELKPIEGDYSQFEELKNISAESLDIWSNKKRDANSDEIEDAAKSLLLAKAWLGKLLGELGSANPYSSGKKEVKDIEPTADTVSETAWLPYMDFKLAKDEYAKFNHIEKVDWLRSEIEKIISKERNIKTTLQMYTPEISHITKNVYTHLCEAKIWLGFEFARIKKESDEK